MANGSNDRPPSASPPSTEEVERLAEQFRPSWELDAPVDPPPEPLEANVPVAPALVVSPTPAPTLELVPSSESAPLPLVKQLGTEARSDEPVWNLVAPPVAPAPPEAEVRAPEAPPIESPTTTSPAPGQLVFAEQAPGQSAEPARGESVEAAPEAIAEPAAAELRVPAAPVEPLPADAGTPMAGSPASTARAPSESAPPPVALPPLPADASLAAPRLKQTLMGMSPFPAVEAEHERSRQEPSAPRVSAPVVAPPLEARTSDPAPTWSVPGSPGRKATLVGLSPEMLGLPAEGAERAGPAEPLKSTLLGVGGSAEVEDQGWETQQPEPAAPPVVTTPSPVTVAASTRGAVATTAGLGSEAAPLVAQTTPAQVGAAAPARSVATVRRAPAAAAGTGSTPDLNNDAEFAPRRSKAPWVLAGILGAATAAALAVFGLGGADRARTPPVAPPRPAVEARPTENPIPAPPEPARASKTRPNETAERAAPAPATTQERAVRTGGAVAGATVGAKPVVQPRVPRSAPAVARPAAAKPAPKRPAPSRPPAKSPTQPKSKTVIVRESPF